MSENSGSREYDSGAPRELGHHGATTSYDSGVPSEKRLPGGRRAVAQIPPIRPDHPTREEENR